MRVEVAIFSGDVQEGEIVRVAGVVRPDVVDRIEPMAITQLRHAIENNRNFQPAHFYLAAALAGLDRFDEARVAAKDGLFIDSTFTIRRYPADAPSDNPAFLAERQRVVPEG